MVTAASGNGQECGKPKNSVRGKRYTSAAFTRPFQSNRRQTVFPAVDQLADNAIAETFFAAVKKKRRISDNFPKKRTSLFEKLQKAMFFYMVAGTGFEPATSGL